MIVDFYKPNWNRHYKAVSLVMVLMTYIMAFFGIFWPNGAVVTALLGDLDGPVFEWSWKNLKDLRNHTIATGIENKGLVEDDELGLATRGVGAGIVSEVVVVDPPPHVVV
eukprot:Filipodium_phascolosomae@DN7612_c0_g1_i1.p2